MIELLGDLLGGGVIGSALGGVFGYFGKKEDNRANAEMQKLRIQEMRVQSQLKVDEIDADAFRETQKTISKIADVIKSSVRVVITLGLVYMFYDNHQKLDKLVNGLGALPQDDLIELYSYNIHSMTHMTGLVVGWWFGNRMAQAVKK